MELKKREWIIKALECCTNHEGDNCPNCPYHYTVDGFNHNCKEDMCADALFLIKELTEEIKDLEAKYDRVYEQAEADIHGNMADGGTSCHWCIDKTKADTVKRMQTMFEERLDISTCGYSTEEVVSDVINTLDMIAEELLEERNI